MKRAFGAAKEAWAKNEPCRKGCGRRPDGRTKNGWSVHEATCDGSPEKRPNVQARGARRHQSTGLCPHGTLKTLRCTVCKPMKSGEDVPGHMWGVEVAP